MRQSAHRLTASALFGSLLVAGCVSDDTTVDEEMESNNWDDDGSEEGDLGFRAHYSMVQNQSVAPLGWYNTTFGKVSGWRYTVCINPTGGNPNLYGDYDGAFAGAPNLANVNFAQFWSQNTGLTPDCIWFDTAQTGTYYLGVYASAANVNSQFSRWRVSSPISSVPTGFQDALTWPLPNSCQNLVNPYSGFNSPWGNDANGNKPFFPGQTNKIHSGVDISCQPGTQVKSACDGSVVRQGNLAAQWGQYIVVQCNPELGTVLTIYYDHVVYSAAPGPIVAGQTLGTIFDMTVDGEGDHLHLAICQGTDAQCVAIKDPITGNLSKESFPGPMINPWIATNGGLYQ